MTTETYGSILPVNTTSGTLPDDVNALKAALLAEREARREFEARASGAEAMVTHLKLIIAKMKRDRFGASAERSQKLLAQLEMELEDLETAAAEDEAATSSQPQGPTNVRPFTRGKPVRAPLPAHLPRERVVLPSPTSCPCCGGKLVKLGEHTTESLESIPRSYKVIQTVREKVLLPLVRGDHATACPIPPDRPRPCRSATAGDGLAREVRRPPTAQPPERTVRSGGY